MLKKFLRNVFDFDVGVKPQTAHANGQGKEFHQQQSEELFVKARQAFDSGEVRNAIKLINESNKHLVKTFASSEDEIRNASRFFGVNEELYGEAKKIKIPIKGIGKEELEQIKNEISWFALNGIKPNYSLMSFLMFKEYEWKEFDEELDRAKKSKNPDDYEIYWFIKNESNDMSDLSAYREKFYSLSLEARVFLASYNAIGRKRKLKEVGNVHHERGFEELKAAGFICSNEDSITIEFPVKEKKQVMFEKKKLEALMRHLSGTIHWDKEYKDGKLEAKNAPGAVFLISGTGGSTLCKKEIVPVRDATKSTLKPHSVGCKCHLSFIRRPDRI